MLKLYVSLCLSCTLALASSQAKEEKLPNIIYVLADDLGYGDLSCLNEDGKIQTSNLDKMASNGMIFTDAHSGSAVCTPTRYGVITGRYAWRSRLKRGVLGGSSSHLINPERQTVADLLKQKGYQTAMMGKWHLGWDWTRTKDKTVKFKCGNIDFSGDVVNGPDSVGFDYYYGHCGSLDMAPYVYVENGKITAPPDRVTQNGGMGFWRKGPTGSDFKHIDVLPNLINRGCKYIDKKAKDENPFFLYLPLPAPHTPILPIKKFEGKSGTNKYGDFVKQVDWHVGQILEALNRNGIADNTLVIFTSDNGCSPQAKFEELEKVGHYPSYKYRGYKADIFEGGHRVPYIVHWPAKVKAGSVSDETICLTDFLATAAEIAEIKVPQDAGEDSYSTLPILLGEKLDKPLRNGTIHHSINGSFAIRKGNWKLIFCPGSGGWSAPRPKEAYKKDLPRMQLYNLDADIGETNNVAAENPEKVKSMTELLEKQIKEGRSTPGTPQKNDGHTPFMPK